MDVEEIALSENVVFRISPIVRITLLSLYGALMIPLPFLAIVADTPISPQVLWGGIVLGGVAVYGALSERVVVNDRTIEVTYPRWVRVFWRRGWCLSWSEVRSLRPRTTGQGGLVYYFVSESGEGYLLPMRIAGFGKLVAIAQQQTGIDTTDVRPLSQPWMYLILFCCTLLLILVDIWTIVNVFNA